MKTYRLGTSDLNVSRIGYGAMSIGGSWDDTPLPANSVRKAAVQVLHTALDYGINLFDHANILAMANLKKPLPSYGRSPRIARRDFISKPNAEFLWCLLTALIFPSTYHRICGRQFEASSN